MEILVMKKFLKVTRVLFISGTIFSLIQNPFISEALAQNQTQTKTNSGFGAQDISTIANGALGIYAGYLGQKQQMMQQQISMAKNQQLIAQMGPNCSNNGKACYANPGKYFPECSLPMTISTMPQNVCGNATPEPTQISSMITYEAIATGWMNYYDKMSNKASNAIYPTGLSCLESKKKALDSQLIEMSNSLSRLQDRLNQDKQIFRDNNKNILESLTNNNDELFGSDPGKKDLKKSSDFAKFFSQNCQTVIGKETLKNGQGVGLNGILQGLSPINKLASDFTTNKTSIANDVHRETDKISATIASNGVEDFLNQGYIPNSDENAKNFVAIKAQLEKQKREFSTAKIRIDKVLAEVGYTAPPMDQKFAVDFEEFSAGANTFFKKKFVNDCVTGAESGIAIPVKDILNALQQKRTNSQGTARNDYRLALETILNSTDMINDKMEQIKALEATFPGMTVTYKDANQTRMTESPYNLFMLTIQKCEDRYGQGDQFSNKGSSGVSYQKKVERARAALNDLKNLNSTFSSKLTESILSQVLTCNDSAMKSGSCSEDSLNSSKEGFCISHAEQCSNEIMGCYDEANKHILKRKANIENLAKIFNSNVAAMISRSNSIYEQQKSAITNITQMIQSKFPGTNFNIPTDMFVTMPELKKDTYGVPLAGDGNLSSFLDGPQSMPEKINKLKEIFAKQKETVDTEITSYIQGQEEAMKVQRGRWEKLAGECKSMIDTSSKAIAQTNNENMKKQVEEDKNIGKFCKKYSSISQNPLGACGKASDLASLADEASARVSSQASTLTEQFNDACDAYNNQNDTISAVNCEDKDGKDLRLCLVEKENKQKNGKQSSKAKKISLARICKYENEKYTNDSELIALASKYFPENVQDKIKGSKKFSDLQNILEQEKIDDGNFFSSLEDFAPKGKAKSICEQVFIKVNGEQSSDSQDIANDKNAVSKALAQAEAKKDLEENIMSLLSDLKSSEAADSKSSLVANVKKIGEQMEGPCDMQSNSNTNKSAFDINNFDSNYLKGLGTAK